MGKVISGIFGTLVVGAIVLFLLFRMGLISWGPGSGTGDGGEQFNTVSDENQMIVEDPEEVTITIVVTQDKYMIDGQEVTLTQIKEKVTDESKTIKVVLEDNYASAKTWDEIKTNLAEWDIVPIEQ